jgi:hypothetical protein
MKPNTLGYLSLILLILTATWLFLTIWDLSSAGPIETLEGALSYVTRADWRFYLSYANVGLLTIVATIWMACLYLFCRPHLPEWLALTGLIFIPVYCTLNLFAYLSQITAVPLLLGLREAAEYRASAEVILALVIQAWPGSAVAFFNGLAYAILGIPSIIFGLTLRRWGKTMKLGGVLLALNGVACILGVIGILLGNSALSSGAFIGGVLFFLCLFPLSWALIRNSDDQNRP